MRGTLRDYLLYNLLHPLSWTSYFKAKPLDLNTIIRLWVPIKKMHFKVARASEEKASIANFLPFQTKWHNRWQFRNAVNKRLYFSYHFIQFISHIRYCMVTADNPIAFWIHPTYNYIIVSQVSLFKNSLLLRQSWASFICFYRIFRIFEKLEDPSSNFPNFRKAIFQFRILLSALSKKIFRCL